MITPSKRQSVLAKVRAIPSLPVAATKVIALLRDTEVKLDDLLRAIQYDQGLTSNVLRLANSAYFAGPRTIGSVREAIMRLGMNRLFQLVITTAVTPFGRQEVRGYDLSAGKLMEHATSVAVGAEELAAQLRVKAPKETFTAGLLHDLGKVALGTFVDVDGDAITKLAYEHHMSFELAEVEVLGINHAEVGAVLLEQWNLPDSIVNVVRWHHKPDRYKGDQLLFDLVHAADHLSYQIGIGAGIDGLNYQASPEVFERLHITDEVVEKVSCQMFAGLDSLRELYGSGAEK
ncbi:MAG: HDOD domain-containing protein [Candidatus Hydrogenedentes bacterium]|nr:HDOD domain-containing protein [Candidatus Hydrogenedentota bacterium]